MATFPNISPSYQVNKISSPKVRTVELGDGYKHRIMFGLIENQTAKEFNLQWVNLSEADADTIETFLYARANDQASFDYTPPEEPSSMKFICKRWEKTIPYPTYATIRATFEQVFEP